MTSRFRNAGQTCICANRIYVQDGMYDKFLEAFTERVKTLRPGDGLESGVTLVRKEVGEEYSSSRSVPSKISIVL